MQLPRIDRTLAIAWRFIRDTDLQWLPVDPFELYRECGWVLVSCDESERITGVRDRFRIRGVADAKTYYRQGRYLTVYDDRQIKSRIRWTLAHEIGHIALAHFTEYPSFFDLSRSMRRWLDREADVFAAELLAPMAVLKSVGARDRELISRICALSDEASGIRARDRKSTRLNSSH